MVVNLYEMSVPLFTHQLYLWIDILKKPFKAKIVKN